MQKKPRFKMPHTLVLIYVLVIAVYVLSLLTPSGEFKRVEKSFQGQSKLITVPGTYSKIEKKFLGPEWLLIAPIRGFQDGSLIIFLIFIFGGAFSILGKTGAIESGIQRLARFFSRSRKSQKIVIPVLMVVFSLAGGVYGMAEESIPFVLIFIPLALSLGYDSIVGVSIPFLASAVGFAAAFFNPFTVGIAQGFSDLPLYSGLTYRLILWVIGTTIAIVFVVIYAEKIRKFPAKSPVYELDKTRDYSAAKGELRDSPWGTPQKIIIWTLFGGIGLLIYGILAKGWYMEEIAALFLGIGLVSGLIARIPPSEIAISFINGAKDVMNVTLIIAGGRAILIILNEAVVLDTILQFTAGLISSAPSIVTAHMMFFTQAIINFFIHSGTAQAALTMPVMAPLSDLVGITRQTTVLAFQMCEVINPILPTSAVTMGVLGVAKIPWEIWAKWFLPLMIVLIVFSLFSLVPPILMNWGPF
ncbi:MAG: putative basic amino acid antiporter YfcC [Candidatus Aminicenantes bacterium]|nr:MAG: putative basic amino acid antiporter YfcC [Candidatus Aminicenantes bacterium]